MSEETFFDPNEVVAEDWDTAGLNAAGNVRLLVVDASAGTSTWNDVTREVADLELLVVARNGVPLEDEEKFYHSFPISGNRITRFRKFTQKLGITPPDGPVTRQAIYEVIAALNGLEFNATFVHKESSNGNQYTAMENVEAIVPSTEATEAA